MEEIGNKGRIEISKHKLKALCMGLQNKRVDTEKDLENRIGARENSCKMRGGHKPERLDCGWS